MAMQAPANDVVGVQVSSVDEDGKISDGDDSDGDPCCNMPSDEVVCLDKAWHQRRCQMMCNLEHQPTIMQKLLHIYRKELLL